ncbi:MAG: hypothetical protein FWD17_12425, partial [Polyangiaceae bacterium]|nr:hypothetical protein [Polyangiaceae bacterium]
SAAAAGGVSGVPSPSESGEGAAFASVFRRIGRAVDGAEGAIRAATGPWSGGERWNAGDLLALQTAAYRYNEIVDTASRLVDHASSSVKTVLQGGGQ